MRKLIIDLYNKYIITFISIIILTLYTFAISGSGFKNYSFSIHLYFVDLVLGTFIAYKIFDVYKDKLFGADASKNIIIKIIVFLISILSIFVLHAINFKFANIHFKDESEYQFLKMVYLLIPQFLIFYLEISDKNISVPQYALMVFKNFLSHFVFTLIVFTGIIILYLIYEALIGSADDNIYLSIVVTLLTFTNMTGYLISMDNTEYKENIFLKVLVYYVMQSIVFVGYIIVYAFMFNIIIKMQLPPNQIYMVGIAVFFIGVLTSYMSQGFEENYKISKIMPLLFIPILIMQYIAIFVRIFNYGLSVYRYIAVMVLVFETIFLVLYIFRYDKLKNILLYAIGLVLILFYIPFINIYSLPNSINNTFFINIIEENDEDVEPIKNIKSCYVYKYFKNEDLDISEYNKLNNIDINYKFNKKDNKYYDLSSKKKQDDVGVIDFKEINGYIANNTSDNVFVLDIDNYMKSIEKIILENDYNGELVEKNISRYIEMDDKLFIISYINFKYDDDTMKFKYITIFGFLLTKN